MSRFIDNVNKFLEVRKIKQTYISMKSGIEVRKLSRILNGVQDVSSTDMEKIAESLGQTVSYFLEEPFRVEPFENYLYNEMAFYIGEPSEGQRIIAQKLLDLIENADEIFSAREDILTAIVE
ncbi:MAG: helix-turn-helix domain-containing protein [Tyzzerella sp.]|nr:helix-turn-helix domain-containing protein [Tyzzerella sp.]